ncbi:hypothetical protein ACIRST_20030 [Kitasatospora sp. NPDC101447]|uniref:hypothetical protein n=1 Tax=Kitasatospora sp. NPDC101447 TaxID=3364102 RepID=UPI0038235B67
MESAAGAASGFTDEAYAGAGARTGDPGPARTAAPSARAAHRSASSRLGHPSGTATNRSSISSSPGCPLMFMKRPYVREGERCLMRHWTASGPGRRVGRVAREARWGTGCAGIRFDVRPGRLVRSGHGNQHDQ